MAYCIEFFELQLRFASKVAQACGIDLASALLRYTNLYVRFGLGRDFDPANPEWQAYVNGLDRTLSQVAWTYNYYLGRQSLAAVPVPPFPPVFGCFSCEVLESGKVRIHFVNADPLEYSPLAKERMPHRLTELRAMFAHIQDIETARAVVGASWLYNLESYRRLFPPAYLASAQVGHNDFAFLPVWGQFVDRHGSIRADLAEKFLNCIEQQHTLQGLELCFPFPSLHLECPVAEFFRFYGV